MIDNKTVNTDPTNEVDIMLANYVFTVLQALPAQSLEIIADALDKAQKINKAGAKIKKCAEEKGVCPAELTLEIVEKFIPLENLSSQKKIETSKEKKEYEFAMTYKQLEEALDTLIVYNDSKIDNINKVHINEDSLQLWAILQGLVKHKFNESGMQVQAKNVIEAKRASIRSHNESHGLSIGHNRISRFYQQHLKPLKDKGEKKESFEHFFVLEQNEFVPKSNEARMLLSKKHQERIALTAARNQTLMDKALKKMIEHNCNAKLVEQRVQINNSSFRLWIRENNNLYINVDIVAEYLKKHEKEIAAHNKQYTNSSIYFNSMSSYYQKKLKKWNFRERNKRKNIAA